MALIPYGLDVLMLLVTLGFVFYKYSTRNFDYWKKKGVPYWNPTPLVGNFLDVFRCRTTLGHLLAQYYQRFYQAPYFGMYVMNTPLLIVKDPKLLKAILVKDFNYFFDRTAVSSEKCDTLASKMLFLLKNPEWKHMRTKMTPVFTTGKIKNMMPLINSAAEEMKVYISKNANQKSLEAKEVLAKFSTDVIASCAFGINAHSFEDENAQFRVMGRKIFDTTWINSVRQTCYFIAPQIVKLLRLPFLDPTVTTFMRSAFWETIRQRENNTERRNDLIDIITQLRKQPTSNDNIKFEGDRVVAQAAQFFTAGFETVSATASFALYELCLQPEIQTKLRAEIKLCLSEHGGIAYEAIQSMKYLHMVICETLRKYPVLPFLDRTCMMDYKLPDSDVIIEKGTPVYIPMFGIHYDPQYFPNPENFNPERFSDENNAKLPSFSYIPFGEGPRICIGERFGLIASKLALIHILSEFEVEKSADTPVPIVFETKTILLTSIVGLPMKFRKIVSEAA